MAIDITNNSTNVTNSAYENEIVAIAKFAIARMGIHPDSDLAITIMDEAEMEALHIQWMDLPGATDVLSFPMDEMKPFSAATGPGIIGDIVLCPDFAAKQPLKHSLGNEIAILTTHGLLHLLGMDHAEAEEEREMFKLQEEIVAEWQATK